MEKVGLGSRNIQSILDFETKHKSEFGMDEVHRENHHWKHKKILTNGI